MYLTLFILLHAHGSAQSQTDSLIIGCWQIDKVAFIEPLEDSVGFMAQMKKTIVCFEHHGRFISMRKENSKTKTVAAGKYSLSADGKTLFQQTFTVDGNTDEPPAEILVLDRQELVLKVDSIELYFKRAP